MADNLLNEEDYKKILEEKFQDNKVKFMSANIEKFSENVEGFMGEHYNLTIKYKFEDEENIIKFFVKTPSTKSEFGKETTKDIYTKETYLYQNLFKKFQKLGYNTDFFPKCYYVKNNETMVLENLLENDFKIFPRAQPFDKEHCKAALKALAYFHANSIAYEEQKSTELKRKFRLNEENSNTFRPSLFTTKDEKSKLFIDSGKECCYEILKLMEKPQKWKEECTKKLENLDCSKIFNKEMDFRKTCTHGDLWSNNMLFKYKNGVPILCTLVDYQVLRHFHLGYDVILLLYSNTTRSFRKNFKEELINYYYSVFEDILKEHGLQASEILKKEDFLETVKHFEPVALMQAVCVRTIVLLPKDYTNASVESKNAITNLLFSKKRAVVAASAFLKDENFKNVIIDDILDLDEFL